MPSLTTFARRVDFNSVLTDDASLHVQNVQQQKWNRKSRTQKEDENYAFVLELRKLSCLTVKIHKQLHRETPWRSKHIVSLRRY